MAIIFIAYYELTVKLNFQHWISGRNFQRPDLVVTSFATSPERHQTYISRARKVRIDGPMESGI